MTRGPMVGKSCSTSKSSKKSLSGRTLREQATQIRNVPLAVAEVVDQAPLGLGRLDLEGIVEGAIGGLYPEILVQDQEWLADSVDDLLGQLLLMLQQPPAAPLLRHIFNGDEDQGRAIAGTPQRCVR